MTDTSLNETNQIYEIEERAVMEEMNELTLDWNTVWGLANFIKVKRLVAGVPELQTVKRLQAKLTP